MKNNRLIYLVLTIGIISFVTLVYFYTIQRDFTKNHREFLISINNLENTQSDLTYLILENSIYTYQNQDKISSEIKELYKDFNQLESSKILDKKTYIPIAKKLILIKKELDKNILNIDDYLINNAGMKNSLLFLTRHIENAKFSTKKDILLLIKANYILKHFYDARKMKDLDYIKKNKFLLSSDSKDKKIQRFIKNFNLHSSFLMKNYPEFIKISDSVLHNSIHDDIQVARKHFSQLALDDFRALDIFASILFTIFLLSLLLILILLYIHIKKNISLQKTKDSLEYSLTYDILTDLYNRKALENDVKTITNPHILIINIDGFKNINDIYGNETGNKLLKALATLLKEKLSQLENIKLFRLGGDEFAVLFNNIDANKAFDIATQLERSISQKDFVFGEFTFNINVSIASNNIAPILENADLALKLIKKDHTNSIICYSEELNLKKSVQENMDTIEIIKSAIQDDRIVPFFQPIINLKTLKIEKYEALVRLRLENGDYLPPFKFLDVSKKSSYYHEITKIMIEKTLKIAKVYPQYRFSINISMIDILNDKLTSILFEKFEEHLSVASKIDIELLESEDLQDISKVQEFIKRLHSYGSKILIDDFGSGYSNFSYFADLDIDIVKIDGSIISKIETNKRQLHMLKSIHSFSNGMNMSNVAEFVENKEIAIILKDLGVEYAQGYYFSPPIPSPLDSDEVVI